MMIHTNNTTYPYIFRQYEPNCIKATEYCMPATEYNILDSSRTYNSQAMIEPLTMTPYPQIRIDSSQAYNNNNMPNSYQQAN